jgi:hypothetical protein
MIHLLAAFVLPLMHHFVEKSLDCFIPSVPPDMPPAYNDLRAVLLLSSERIVTKT